ncbi:MAG: ABC transporter permease [Verrucomicrobia bacterium]|nr:MAG: ABC transporter permease [Verrucomicrobiota bacterium]
MLLTLLAKDIRRAARNPVRWLIPLAIPILITALIGIAFSPRSGGGTLGTIRIAVVDEDTGQLGQFLGNMPPRPGGDDMPFQLETRLLSREAALREVNNNEIAAVIIIPDGFLDAWLRRDGTATIEVIKNPAQAIHPAIVEEGVTTLATLMHAASQILGDDLLAWRGLLEGDADLATRVLRAADLLKQAGERLEPLRDYLSPPLVTWHQREDLPAADSGESAGESTDPFNLFGYLLIGMAAMFLLYMADNAMRDLYRELEHHTLARYQTLHAGLGVMLASKVLFAVVMLLTGAAILFLGGSLAFSIHWERPLVLTALTLSYALFAAGFLGLVAALAGSERRADRFNNILVITLALAGGCMFPPDGLPAFIREGIMPWMPTAWYAMSARGIQLGVVSTEWISAVVRLAGVGALTAALAATLFHRRLSRGIRA